MTACRQRRGQIQSHPGCGILAYLVKCLRRRKCELAALKNLVSLQDGWPHMLSNSLLAFSNEDSTPHSTKQGVSSRSLADSIDTPPAPRLTRLASLNEAYLSKKSNSNDNGKVISSLDPILLLTVLKHRPAPKVVDHPAVSEPTGPYEAPLHLTRNLSIHTVLYLI
jgi:hypothetical protein